MRRGGERCRREVQELMRDRVASTAATLPGIRRSDVIGEIANETCPGSMSCSVIMRMPLGCTTRTEMPSAKISTA